MLRMLRWKRPYRDWRLVGWYPVLVLAAATTVYSPLTFGLPDRLAWIGLLALCLTTAGLWRVTQVGVLLDDDRIKVRNLFRTRILRWADVAEVRDGTEIGGDPELVFVLKSGERVSTLVTVITHGGYEVYLTRRQFLRLMTRLREQLATVRQFG